MWLSLAVAVPVCSYLCMLVYIGYIYIVSTLHSICVKNEVVLNTLNNEGHKQVALVVVAHPDDEAMFFTPLLTTLSHNMIETYILCLSNGNADGLGAVREKELLKGGPILGVSHDHISIIDDDRLKDGMSEVWDPAVVSEVVSAFVKQKKVSDIYTFDSYGVSGHLNHIACYHGVMQLASQANNNSNNNAEEGNLTIWTLDSVFILRKYFGVLFDLPIFDKRALTTETRRSLYLAAVEPLANWKAMQAHSSQFSLWPYFYRRIFVLVSRYSYLNKFTKVESSKHNAKNTFSKKKVD